MDNVACPVTFSACMHTSKRHAAEKTLRKNNFIRLLQVHVLRQEELVTFVNETRYLDCEVVTFSYPVTVRAFPLWVPGVKTPRINTVNEIQRTVLTTRTHVIRILGTFDPYLLSSVPQAHVEGNSLGETV
jgi:hypothetical protein